MWLIVREFESLAKDTYIVVVAQNGSHNFSCFNASSMEMMFPSSLTCAAKMCLIGGIFKASLLVGGRIGASPLLASVGMVSSRNE